MERTNPESGARHQKTNKNPNDWCFSPGLYMWYNSSMLEMSYIYIFFSFFLPSPLYFFLLRPPQRCRGRQELYHIYNPGEGLGFRVWGFWGLGFRV